jgi:type I pantothenate kinase
MNDLLPVVRAAGVERPVVIGIAGPVSVGKTTIANALATAFTVEGSTTHVVSTDSFLLSNAVLTERNLAMRKGFPETYEIDAVVTTLERAKKSMPVALPVYSHDTYDILPDVLDETDPVDVLILEGVIALQSPVRDALDLAVYVDAPEEVVRGWFVRRFLAFVDAARENPSSFYHGFGAMSDDDVRSIAEATWDGINGVNLREHIEPSKGSADIVIVKDAAHAIVEIIGA